MTEGAKTEPPTGMPQWDRSLTEGPVEVTIVIPAFNEEKALAKDIQALRAAMEATGRPYEILVVDDGSSDATAEVAVENGARLLRHYSNRGGGAARKTGIRAARAEIVVVIDGDNTYPPHQVPALLEYMNRCDMVVGDRTVEMGTQRALRTFAKRLIRWLASYLTRKKIYDLNSGMRAFRKETAMLYFNILPEGHSWVSTITIAYLASGLTVKYHPIEYYKRTGSSTFRPIADTAAFIGLVFRTVMFFKPLRFFNPVVAALAAAGVYKTIWIDKALGPNRISESSMILLLGALILFALGVLAELQVRLNRRW